MCLIGLHYKALAGTVLLLAANRDEYYRRPSAALGPWPDQPEVFGGRDLQGGGSWLALHRNGRFAAVTNVRMGLKPPPQALSRGSLVTDYVCGQLSSLEFAHHLTQQSRSYAPFNLLFGRVD
ncbi:MAG: NRDE family protein, partial [Aquaspirillum sp.]